MGTEDWNEKYNIPEDVKVTFCPEELKKEKLIYEIVFIEHNLTEAQAKVVYDMSMSYCLFVLDSFDMDDITKKLFDRRMGNVLAANNVQDFLSLKNTDVGLARWLSRSEHWLLFRRS